jgi:hypothetical protein
MSGPTSGCWSMVLYFLSVYWPPSNTLTGYEVGYFIADCAEKAYQMPGAATYLGMSSEHLRQLALGTQI